MNDETTLYSATVEFEGDVESYVQVFWAYGRTIGEAKSKMEEAIRKSFGTSGIISEIDPFEGDPQFDEKDGSGLAMWKSTRYWYPKEYSFRLPDGVIKSCLEGEYDLHQILPGYVIHGEQPSIFLDAVVHKEDLIPVYKGILTLFREFRVFWIKIQDDWEDAGRSEMFTNDSLTDSTRIGQYLDGRREEIVSNGHLHFTAFLETGKTNLTVTDHKMIQIISLDKGLIGSVGQYLESVNIPEKKNLINISKGFHHWHYCSPALTRPRFIEALLQEGFQAWQPKTISQRQSTTCLIDYVT